MAPMRDAPGKRRDPRSSADRVDHPQERRRDAGLFSARRGSGPGLLLIDGLVFFALAHALVLNRPCWRSQMMSRGLPFLVFDRLAEVASASCIRDAAAGVGRSADHSAFQLAFTCSRDKSPDGCCRIPWSSSAYVPATKTGRAGRACLGGELVGWVLRFAVPDVVNRGAGPRHSISISATLSVARAGGTSSSL